MEGRLWVTSTVGIGSKFQFVIPCPLKQDALPPKMDSRLNISSPATDGEINVLIVEDDLVNQKLMIKFAEKHSICYDLAGNGKEAVEMALKNQYDLILMDIQMPVMDGFEAARLIRQQEKNGRKKTPIIGVTAYAMKGDREKCLNAGMDEYISKPIKVEELLNCMLKVINS